MGRWKGVALALLMLLVAGCQQVLPPPRVTGFWQGELTVTGDGEEYLLQLRLSKAGGLGGWVKLVRDYSAEVSVIESAVFAPEAQTIQFTFHRSEEPQLRYTCVGTVSHYSLSGECYLFDEQAVQTLSTGLWHVRRVPGFEVVTGYWDGKLISADTRTKVAQLNLDICQHDGEVTGYVRIGVGGSVAFLDIVSGSVSGTGLVELQAEGALGPGAAPQRYLFTGTLVWEEGWDRMVGECLYTVGTEEQHLVWEAEKLTEE